MGIMMFLQKTIDFLENRLQNSKVWYKEHKTEYREYVLEPFIEFVNSLAPALLSLDDMIICEPKVNKAISRIYRDMRFSEDKSLYRDIMRCFIMRNKKLYNGFPGFLFELSPNGFRYGCGYYAAGSGTMDSIR